MKHLNQFWTEITANRGNFSDERSALLWVPPLILAPLLALALPFLAFHFAVTYIDPESVWFGIGGLIITLLGTAAAPALPIATIYAEMLLLRLLGRQARSYQVFLDDFIAISNPRCPEIERGLARLLHSAVGPRP